MIRLDRNLSLAAVCAALLLACNRSEVAGVEGAESRPTASETADPSVFDQVQVQTSDEAYDELYDDITEENVDAELERLMQEIDDNG